MTANMYKMFKTDKRLEQDGILLDYGPFRVTVARMGGANKKFFKLLELRTKPMRRAIQADSADRDKLLALTTQTFAETCVLNWEVNRSDTDVPSWERGIEAEDGTLLEFNKQNVIDTLTKLPDLLDDLQTQATNQSLYRADIEEAEVKNS